MAELVEYKNNEPSIGIAIDKVRMVIGRGKQSDICIENELVSKEHAALEIVERPGEAGAYDYVLHDLGSTNGTYVNEEPITFCRLRDQDMIRIGNSFFKFIQQDTENMNETVQLHKSWIPGLFYTKGKKKK